MSVDTPAPQGFLGHLIARAFSQEECRDEEARSGFCGGGGSPEGDERIDGPYPGGGNSRAPTPSYCVGLCTTDGITVRCAAE